MLLAIDPSVRSPGVALFDGYGRLVAASRVKRDDLDKLSSDGQKWVSMAASVWRWVDKTLSAIGHDYTEVVFIVFEKPQIYTARKSKGDPNDLIGLAGMAMAVVALFHANRCVLVDSPTPAEWIGNLPKTTTGNAKESARAKRILSRLTPEELAAVPDQHDAIDAVGLGLWKLGRLKPRRNYSSGT